MKIELSEKEAKLLDDYAFRKLINLENSNLCETPCYKMFMNIHRQIAKNSLQKDKETL